MKKIISLALLFSLLCCACLAREMAAVDIYFSYGPDMKKNHFFYCQSDNIHQDLTSRCYLYNAFLDGLFQE